MNTCDTCQHWKEAGPYHSEGWGYCFGEMIQRYNYDAWGNRVFVDDGRDDQITGSGIVTQKKFGCIHWQEKK